MTRSVSSFYKKKLLTQGGEKTNQVLKRQKAIADQSKIESKLTWFGLGTGCLV